MKYLSHRSWAITVLLIIITAIGSLSLDMYLPALDTIKTDFHTTESYVQLTMSIFLFIIAIGQLVTGPLSDKYGRRLILFWGMVIYTLASVACTQVTSIEGLIIARAFQAIGVAAGPGVASAVVRDVYGNKESAKVMAYIGSAMALSPMVSPVIGGAVVRYAPWRTIFDIHIVIGVILCLMLFVFFEESNKRLNPHAVRIKMLLKNYKTLLHSKIFMYHTAIGTAVFIGMFAFLSASAFIFMDYLHVSKTTYGLYFGISSTGFLLGNQISARLAERLSFYRLIKVGSFICLCAGAWMTVISWLPSYSAFSLIMPMPFFMLGMGIVLPLTQAGAINEFPDMAGTAASLIGAIRLGIPAIVGVFVGMALNGNAHPMTMTLFLGGALAFAISLLMSEGKKAYEGH